MEYLFYSLRYVDIKLIMYKYLYGFINQSLILFMFYSNVKKHNINKLVIVSLLEMFISFISIIMIFIYFNNNKKIYFFCYCYPYFLPFYYTFGIRFYHP